MKIQSPSGRSRLRSHGFSMFEILLVLGIISVLGAVIFAIYPQARDNNYANTERQRLLQAIVVVQTAHMSTGNYVGLSTDSANQAGAFVKESNKGSREPGTEIQNIWGGTIEMAAAPNSKFMEISYTQVSVEGCLKLSTGIGKSVVSVVVNEREVFRQTDGSDVDVSGIVEACNEDPEGATMVFTAN